MGDSEVCATTGGSDGFAVGGSSCDVSTVDTMDYDYAEAFGGAGDSLSGAGGTLGQTIGTIDYDYAAAYGGDRSLSEAGGTVGSRFRQAGADCLEVVLPTTAPLGSGNTIFSDDPTFEEVYEEVREILLDVYAPGGKLGVIIDTPDDGAPMIHAIKEDSPIADKVRVGDKLVAIDDEDVRPMTAKKVSKLLSTKANNPSRKLTIIRHERGRPYLLDGV